MMFVINVLTFKIMIIIIESLELATPGETDALNRCKPP